MKYKVTIVGVTPYMQHRMDDAKLEEWEKKRGKIIERDDVSHADLVRAEFHSHRNANGDYFIPSEQIRSALIAGGTFMKSKVGARTKSMKSTVAAMFLIDEPEIIIPPFDTIDKRSAVNKNVKARIIVVRPKWTNWEATFTLDIDEETITQETIKEIITSTGKYVGIGSFRPTCNGYFGRFALKNIERLT